MGWNYTDKLIDMFHDALLGSGESFAGRVKEADGIGHYGSIACGDAIVFSFRTKKGKTPEEDQIIEARYETFGCTSAIASSEALCYLIENQNPTPIEALEIKAEDIANFLEGMPTQKMHCSVMGAEVLREAFKDWAKKRGVDYVKYTGQDHSEHDESPLICTCYNKTENEIRKAVKDLSIFELDELKEKTQAGTSCNSCIDRPGGLRDILKEEREHYEENASTSAISIHEEKDNQELEARSKLVIDTAIRPHLDRKGISMRLVKVRNGIAYCEFSSDYEEKLIELIENILKELVHPEIRLVDF